MEEAGQRTERGDRVRPPRERTCFSLRLSCSEAESVSPGRGGRARKQTVQEGGDGGGTKPPRGKPSQREAQRAETAKERNRRAAGWRLGESGRESLGSRPNLQVPRGPGAPGSRAWGPHCPQWSPRPQERRWAALRRHRPTGGGRGKCEAPKRRWGAKLTFLAHAGAGCAELSRRGASDPRALTSRRRRRAGQGRAGLGCAQHPERPGFARVWQPALVPPLSAAQKPMARRPLPRARLPRPRGWPLGRAGEGGWGDWALGSPAEAFLETAGGGRAHALGEGSRESKPRARAAQEDFLVKF